MEQQLETEIFNRKQTETLNESLHAQCVELEKKVSAGYQVPEGYSVIENRALERLMGARNIENISLTDFIQVPTSTPVKSIKQDISAAPISVGKAKSEIIVTRKPIHSTNKDIRSQSRLETATTFVPYLETNIGDTADNQLPPERCEEDVLKIFMKKKSSKTSLDMSNRRDTISTFDTETFKGSMISLNTVFN